MLRDRLLLLTVLAQPVLWSAPVWAATTEAERPTITLEQAVTLGLRHSASVVEARGSVKTAAAARRTAAGAYLPTASLTASGSLSSSTRFNTQTNLQVTGAGSALNAGASLGWDVFTGGARGAQTARATAQQTVAGANLVQQERSTTFLITQAFYAALRTEQLTGVARSRIERAQAGLAAAEKRALVGSSTRSDVLRASLELNSARTAELEALTHYEAAELQLGQWVGWSGRAGAQPLGGSEQVKPVKVPPHFVEEVLGELPALKAARASVDSAHASVSEAQAKYWPTVRLSAGYDWYTQDARFADGRTSWSTRLGVTLPIFDGFVREESIERARVQEYTSRSQRSELERVSRSDLEQTVNRFSLAQSRLSLAVEAAEVAREDLRVQQERYTLGVTTMLDFLTSQENLATAETDQVTARFDYETALAELEIVSGRKL